MKTNTVALRNALEIHTRIRYHVNDPHMSMGAMTQVTIENITREIAINGLDVMHQRFVDDPPRGDSIYDNRVIVMHPDEYNRLIKIEEEYNRRK